MNGVRGAVRGKVNGLIYRKLPQISYYIMYITNYMIECDSFGET